jgi:hypothetical protein
MSRIQNCSITSINEEIEFNEVLIVLGLKVQRELINENDAEGLNWLHENYFENLLALGAVVLIAYGSETVRYSTCLEEA